jgi:hypothetical protein
VSCRWPNPHSLTQSPLRFRQSNAHTTAVLRDELDAGLLKGRDKRFSCLGPATNLALSCGLKPFDRW